MSEERDNSYTEELQMIIEGGEIDNFRKLNRVQCSGHEFIRQEIRNIFDELFGRSEGGIIGGKK